MIANTEQIETAPASTPAEPKAAKNARTGKGNLYHRFRQQHQRARRAPSRRRI